MNSTSDALMTIDEYKQSLLTSIHIGITATNNDDVYSVGLRNGLRICKAYIDGQEPEYEEVKNDPLTWDELKTMVGKPVWIEYADDKQQAGWVLIAKNPERPTFGKPKLFTLIREDEKFYLTISGYGKRWRAYRKERK